MKKIFVASMALGAVVFGMALSASAIPVAVTYTADNVQNIWAQNGSAPNYYGPGANYNKWTVADTRVLDLAGDHPYQLVFNVANGSGLPSTPSDPMAFMAQIDIGNDGSAEFVSDASWEVATGQGNFSDFNDPLWGWTTATVYAANGSGIWGSNLGGPIAGIGSANWIGDGLSSSSMVVRGTFRTPAAPVPEPGTILLLGTGLAGLAAAGRRKRKHS